MTPLRRPVLSIGCAPVPTQQLPALLRYVRLRLLPICFLAARMMLSYNTSRHSLGVWLMTGH
jgi:hypothetical protein